MGDVLGQDWVEEVQRRIDKITKWEHEMRAVNLPYAEAKEVIKKYPHLVAVPLADIYEYSQDGSPRGDAGYHWVGKTFVGRCSKKAPGKVAQEGGWLVCYARACNTAGRPLSIAEIMQLGPPQFEGPPMRRLMVRK